MNCSQEDREPDGMFGETRSKVLRMLRKQRFYIIPQRYKDCWGNKPLSFAIYRGRTFLAYSFSLARAYVALQLIKRTFEKGNLNG